MLYDPVIDCTGDFLLIKCKMSCSFYSGKSLGNFGILTRVLAGVSDSLPVVVSERSKGRLLIVRVAVEWHRGVTLTVGRVYAVRHEALELIAVS